MSTINLDSPVTTLAGEQLEENGTKLTAGRVFAAILDTMKVADGLERVASFSLAVKCFAGGSIELTLEEKTLLAKALDGSQIQSNVVVGQLRTLLD